VDIFDRRILLNRIVGGHQRVEAAKAMKLKKVPVVYINMDETKEHMLNLALNEIAGEWDETKLYNMLMELNAANVDITLTGFDEPIIDEIIQANKDKEKEKIIDVTPQVPDKAKSKRGEIYQLGDHRLMCGDSTSEEDFKLLMDGKIGDMCWTDPPYGVSYKGTNNPNGKDWGVMDNDGLRDDELYKFLEGMYKNVSKHTNPNRFPAIEKDWHGNPPHNM